MVAPGLRSAIELNGAPAFCYMSSPVVRGRTVSLAIRRVEVQICVAD